jgi:hypothetical protein
MTRHGQCGSLLSKSKSRPVVQPVGRTETVTTYTGAFRDSSGKRHKASFAKKAEGRPDSASIS